MNDGIPDAVLRDNDGATVDVVVWKLFVENLTTGEERERGKGKEEEEGKKWGDGEERLRRVGKNGERSSEEERRTS